MAKDNKIHLPSSGGGLVRYSDDVVSKFEISPLAIMIFIAAVIVFEVLLYKGLF